MNSPLPLVAETKTLVSQAKPQAVPTVGDLTGRRVINTAEHLNEIRSQIDASRISKTKEVALYVLGVAIVIAAIAATVFSGMFLASLIGFVTKSSIRAVMTFSALTGAGIGALAYFPFNKAGTNASLHAGKALLNNEDLVTFAEIKGIKLNRENLLETNKQYHEFKDLNEKNLLMQQKEAGEKARLHRGLANILAASKVASSHPPQ